MKQFTFAIVLLFSCQLGISQIQKDTLIIGYTSAPPFIVQENEVLSGINIWLWERIAKDLDLKYKLVKMDFSEMLNALKQGDIDVCINPLTITSERNKVMAFTDSFYASNSTIAVSEFSPFHKLVRFLKGFFNANFLKGLFILLLIIFLFGLFGWYFERKRNPEHFRYGYRGIWDGLWWSAVTLTTVGYGDKAPKTRWGKMAALALMFGGLLFISGLTASIASSLTISQMNNDPDSFNEFKERAVGSIKNSSSAGFLRTHFFKNVHLFDDITAGLVELKNDEIKAFIYDEPILKYHIKKDSSLHKINILPIKFDVQFYAFGLAKDKIELEQAISQHLLEIIETEEWQIVLHEFGLSGI